MKRSALVGMGLMLGVAGSANAQLSMQMGNGWALGISGNVNAFYIYQSSSSQSISASGVGSGTFIKNGQLSRINTGLLPANLNFDVNGKEGGLNLGVHFGFFPQVSSGGNTGSYFGNDAAGAQIDMRQAYLTVGGDWGQFLFGKNLGLYQRGNIVSDMTIFGVGPAGAGRGTTLGRIAYGYLYTDFRPQFTYSTPAGKPASWSIGLFEPATFGDYSVHSLPRVETELTYGTKFSGNNSFGFFASGFVQNSKNAISTGTNTTTSKTATGAAGGLKFGFGGLSLVGAGFVAKGQGTVFMGSLNGSGVSDANDDTGVLRTSTGWYGQATFTPPSSKVTFGFSYGGNHLKQTANDIANGTESALGPDGFKKRTAIIGLISYQVTKSFRVLGEYTNFSSNVQSGVKDSKANQFAFGTMLFF